MSDELLPYYEKELAFIRQMGAEFAQEHPKIAGRLGIQKDSIEDPHAARLIEAFAYLNARIQHKLDDEFPELSDALLGILFPHYQRPLPSMAIAQYEPDPDQLDSPYTIPAQTLLETDPLQGEPCRFTGIYDVDLLPLRIASAHLIGRPFVTPGSASVRGAHSVLKISFKTFNDAILLSDVKPKKIRLYLNDQPQHSHPLYRMLLNECLQVVMAGGDDDLHPQYLGVDAVRPVGFGEQEGLLPYPDNAFIGYRLLTEFFVFPEKFMFIDIDLDGRLPTSSDHRMDLYFYFKTTDVELEHNINDRSFAMGCTPMINLFSHKADPIRVDHTQTEYPVIPDCRRPRGYEVYSVDQVTAAAPGGDAIEYLPFYGLDHRHQGDNAPPYWQSVRRGARMGIHERDDGTDMYLSLTDLNFNPHTPQDRTLIVQTTCSNRDLPGKLPYNTEQPRFQCVNGAPPCKHIRAITQPTASIRPALRNRARWKLISHLNLNARSLTGHAHSTESFREMLRLYDFRESSVTRGLIDAVSQVQARPISAPMNIGGHATICRGLEVEVELDEALLSGNSSFLFATVLEHFFALYCPLNGFTRTLVKLKNREGYLKKCPPRNGNKILL